MGHFHFQRFFFYFLKMRKLKWNKELMVLLTTANVKDVSSELIRGQG